jgi:SRSO17 transposase
MSYITFDTPDFLAPFFAKFDCLFNRAEPQQYFRLYGTGVLLEIKRKNVQAIDSHIISGNYQGLHHFISDAPWDEVSLNHQRLSWLQSNRQTTSTHSGYLIVDDTGNPKSGDATFATKKQYMGCLGKVDCGQVVVTSHYADASKDWPVNLLAYVPQDRVPVEGFVFEKHTIATTLRKTHAFMKTIKSCLLTNSVLW